jgi:GR25 family glycosyltransferase involved in LPS biosynthesis
VISLKRTPERLSAFYNNNQQALSDWNVEVIDGIDGIEQEQMMCRSRWVSNDAAQTWTRGAIGSGLSHIKAWQRCIERNEAVLVAEDDAVLTENLKSKLEDLKIIGAKRKDAKLVLLGWNLDSLLHAELSQGLELISLFEPIYPGLNEIRRIINNKTTRYSCKLNRCFGLPAYWINPNIAKELLQTCKPLKSEKNKMTRGIPEHQLTTLDGMLSNRYHEMKAEIIIPPLTIALNNQETSLTRRKNIQNFQG